jgi:TRAP-type C4-dicarboxylate transport system permease small subunit
LKRFSQIVSQLERAGRAGEDAVLVVVLTGMIVLASSQIVMRNLFDFGFIWSDELLRLMVLWIAVGGAVAASRDNKHISIDVLGRFLPGRLAKAANTVIYLFTAIICGLVTSFSYAFVKMSHEFGDVLLGQVPAWMLQAVLPLGFALITWRYGLFTIREIAGLLKPGDEQ